jgi:hypothetical protein
MGVVEDTSKKWSQSRLEQQRPWLEGPGQVVSQRVGLRLVYSFDQWVLPTQLGALGAA